MEVELPCIHSPCRNVSCSHGHSISKRLLTANGIGQARAVLGFRAVGFCALRRGPVVRSIRSRPDDYDDRWSWRATTNTLHLPSAYRALRWKLCHDDFIVMKKHSKFSKTYVIKITLSQKYKTISHFRIFLITLNPEQARPVTRDRNEFSSNPNQNMISTTGLPCPYLFIDHRILIRLSDWKKIVLKSRSYEYLKQVFF